MVEPAGWPRLFAVLLALLPGGLWCAWWLWGVNWKKTWPVLAQGGWAPLLLLMYLAALVWSKLAPGPCQCLSFVTVPNFWWQLLSVCSLVITALFCGWLQGYFGWTPIEVNLEPPPVGHGGEHGHH